MFNKKIIENWEKWKMECYKKMIDIKKLKFWETASID